VTFSFFGWYEDLCTSFSFGLLHGIRGLLLLLELGHARLDKSGNAIILVQAFFFDSFFIEDIIDSGTDKLSLDLVGLS